MRSLMPFTPFSGFRLSLQWSSGLEMALTQRKTGMAKLAYVINLPGDQRASASWGKEQAL